MKPYPADVLRKGATRWVGQALKASDVAGDKAIYSKMVHDVAEASVSHNHVVTVDPDQPLEDLTAIDAARRIVLRPSEYLPSPDDLPQEGADLFEEFTDDEGEKHTYFEYACVLIALYRCESIGKVNQVLGAKLKDEESKVIHKMHDYYVGKGIQYDDSSQRSKVMQEWGYRMIWAGEAAWDRLPGRIDLPRGQYIFDIKGHTVKVRVLKDIWAHTTITSLKEYFEPDSNPSNFTRGEEFKELVTSIWKTG